MTHSSVISVTNTKHLIFTLDDHRYGIPLSSVREVIAMTTITEVPQVSSFFKGLINLRGRIISVVDLRIKLGLRTAEYRAQQTSIIITDVNELTIGNIVDDVNEVIGLEARHIESELDISSAVRRDFITGVAKFEDRPLTPILDVKKLLSPQELEMTRVAAANASPADVAS